MRSIFFNMYNSTYRLVFKCSISKLMGCQHCYYAVIDNQFYSGRLLIQEQRWKSLGRGSKHCSSGQFVQAVLAIKSTWCTLERSAWLSAAVCWPSPHPRLDFHSVIVRLLSPCKKQIPPNLWHSLTHIPIQVQQWRPLCCAAVCACVYFSFFITL